MTDHMLDDELRIVTVTSEAMEGEMLCGMEVELASSNDLDGLPSTSWSLSSRADRQYDCSAQNKSTKQKYEYSGPYLPDTCEVDDVADGRCSPLYNLKRKASRSKQVMQLQLTNPTLSINSMTDMSDCPSDEVSVMSYARHVDEILDDFENVPSRTTTTLADVISSSSEETDSSAASLISSSQSSTESTSASDDSTGQDYQQPVDQVVAGPELPPPASVTRRPIINVLEPRPDQIFIDMIERSFASLQRITLKRSNVPQTFAPSLYVSLILVRNRQRASFMAIRDCGTSGFLLAPIHAPSLPVSSPLVIQADNAGNEITLRNMGIENPCASILESFQLAGEAARLKSQLLSWTTGMMCCDPEAIRDALYPPESTVSVKPTRPDDDAPSSRDDDATAVLFEDEELRTIMAKTKGGNDLSALLTCLSDDTAATIETDDGLQNELKALDIIEEDLRQQLQDVDLLVKGVYVQDVKMKSESSDSLFEHDASYWQRIQGTPRPSQSRRVRFSKKNKEYVFGGHHADDDDDKDEGLGELILATCEELYYVLEEMSEEISFACVKTFKPAKRKCHTKPPRPSGTRKVQRSTIHFCA